MDLIFLSVQSQNAIVTFLHHQNLILDENIKESLDLRHLLAVVKECNGLKNQIRLDVLLIKTILGHPFF